VICRATVWVEQATRGDDTRVAVERLIVAERAQSAAEFAARLRARWAGGGIVVTVGPVSAAPEQQQSD